MAAHDLLVELADGCAENLVYIVSQLISMHHIGDPAILKEWEVRCIVKQLDTINFAAQQILLFYYVY